MSSQWSGVFRTLAHIYDGAFSESSKRLLVVGSSAKRSILDVCQGSEYICFFTDMHFTIPDIVRVQVLEFMYSFSKFTNLFPEYNLNSLSIGIVCAYQKWSYSVRFGAK